MAYNRERLFPDQSQRELQDAADDMQTVAEKIVYATRKKGLDTKRLIELDREWALAHGQFVLKLLKVL
jgi:hypothetical protein